VAQHIGKEGEITSEQERFVQAWLANGCNGTKAGLAIGKAESYAAHYATKTLKRPQVKAYIQECLLAKGCTPEFCKSLLLEHARGDLADFEAYLDGSMSLTALRQNGVDTRLVKRASIRVTDKGSIIRDIELHSAQAAVVHLAALLEQGGESGEPEGHEVTRRVVIEEYRQRKGKPVDLGISGIPPIGGRVGDDSDFF